MRFLSTGAIRLVGDSVHCKNVKYVMLLQADTGTYISLYVSSRLHMREHLFVLFFQIKSYCEILKTRIHISTSGVLREPEQHANYVRILRSQGKLAISVKYCMLHCRSGRNSSV